MDKEIRSLISGISADEPCPYLPGRLWRNFLLDPGAESTAKLHERLFNQGFRRMGKMFFRPICDACDSCRPLRLNTNLFHPGKNLRKIRNRNQDLRLKVRRPHYSEEKRALMARYLESRHKGPMEAQEEAMRETMFSGSAHSYEMDYFLDDRLVGVGIVDLAVRS